MRRFVAGLLLIGVACLALLMAVIAVGLLDSVDVGSGSARDSLPSRTLTVLQSSNQVHYAVHLLLGSALEVCPCTRTLAATQYSKASHHASTPRQMALVAADRPHGLGDTVRDAIELSGAGIKRLLIAVS
jgi:hypothetical protein